MGRTVFVNGEFVDEIEAKVSVFDRGFLFADGVYEVTTVLNGKLIDNAGHLARLQRSLGELHIVLDMSPEEIESTQIEVVKRNGLTEGVLYMQVTRGAADRDFAFPPSAKPGVVMFTQAKNLLQDPLGATGISVVSVPDIRWRRRDIKSIGLLASCLAKQAAIEAGVNDAWLVEDGFVTEGASSNAYIVNENDEIITRHISSDILNGITRTSILQLAIQSGFSVVERPFTIDEARNAQEAFITSASTFLYPVISIDKVTIGNGTPGPISSQLRNLYIEAALDSVN